MDQLSRKIWIQQDGTKSHISADDNEFKEALHTQEINAKPYAQTANSPDVNLLHRGFFELFRASMMQHLKTKRN